MKTTAYNEQGENISNDNKKLISKKSYIARCGSDGRFYPYLALKTGPTFVMWRTDGALPCISPTLLIFMDEEDFDGLF